MFNAARVAVSVVVLALVGGLAYVALPTVERTVSPAAPAAIDPSDFAGFSGTFRATPCEGGERTIVDWGLILEGDLCSSMELDVSDDRLNGVATAAHNAFNFQDDYGYGVRTLATRIVNDGGSWSGTGLAFHDADDDIMRYELLLAGEGAYDGLSAMLSLTSDSNFLDHEAEGVIFPGELPPYPVLDDVESLPSGSGQTDAARYAGFTGQVTVGGGQGIGQASLGEFGTEVRDETYWGMAVESTDPRIAGVQESLMNYDSFGFDLGRVHATADRIVNDEGAWVGTAHGYIHPETGAVHFADLFTGEGAYEGLTAISIASMDRIGHALHTDGVIFPGGLPPYPELPPVE